MIPYKGVPLRRCESTLWSGSVGMGTNGSSANEMSRIYRGFFFPRRGAAPIWGTFSSGKLWATVQRRAGDAPRWPPTHDRNGETY